MSAIKVILPLDPQIGHRDCFIDEWRECRSCLTENLVTRRVGKEAVPPIIQCGWCGSFDMVEAGESELLVKTRH